MAHRILSIDRQEGLKQAWHQLTTVRKEILLEKNWLTDWDVIPAEVFLADGTKLPFVQLVCTDNPKIYIGSPYSPKSFVPITNAQFLAMIKESVTGTSHKIVSVGSVRGRGRTFVSFEMEQLPTFKAGGRKFVPYLNFGNGHDRSSVLWVNTSNIDTVCDNTFSFNLAAVENKAKTNGEDESFGHASRHTRNIKTKLPEIATLVDKAVGVQAEFAAAFDDMAAHSISKADAQFLFAGILVKPTSSKMIAPTHERLDMMTDLFTSGKGNHGQTRADAFSAVTDYYTHHSSGAKASKEQQQFASEYGAGAAQKARAFSILRDETKLAVTIERGAELMEKWEKADLALS